MTDKSGWAAAAAWVAAYLAFMLTAAYAPNFYAAPVVEGGLFSMGLLLGIALVFFGLILVAAFIRRLNRSPGHQADGTRIHRAY